MTKDEALRLALEAFGEIAWSNETQWQSDRAKVAITAIKAALEAKDEPWSPVSIGVDVTQDGTHVMAMRLRPNGVNEIIYSQFHPLAQQEQPKVRTGNCLRVGVCASEGHKIQPQRTWVGLTDEEVADIERNSITRRQAIRAIEAKLKEKNGYA